MPQPSAHICRRSGRREASAKPGLLEYGFGARFAGVLERRSRSVRVPGRGRRAGSAVMVDNLVTSLAAAGAPERMICRTSRAEMEVDTVTSKSST